MTKYLYLLMIALIFLSACAPGGTETQGLPWGVYKFHDGNVTCYLFHEHAISCVKGSGGGGVKP